MHPLVCLGSGYVVGVAIRAAWQYLDEQNKPAAPAAKENTNESGSADDSAADDSAAEPSNDVNSLIRQFLLLLARSGLVFTEWMTQSIKSVTSVVRSEMDELRTEGDNASAGNGVAKAGTSVGGNGVPTPA